MPLRRQYFRKPHTNIAATGKQNFSHDQYAWGQPVKNDIQIFSPVLIQLPR
jgi:hypothetical protein